MTKEIIFKIIIEDPIFKEKSGIEKKDIDKIKFIDSTENKLTEIIKLAINGSVDGESETITGRKINQYLNR